MKTRITGFLLFMICVGMMFTTSCSKDDDTIEIMLDDIVLDFTKDAQELQVDLPLDDVSNYWHLYSPTSDAWCYYERIPGRKQLYVGMEVNNSSGPRTSYIMVRSKNHTQRIVINQDNGGTDVPLSSTYASISEEGGTQTVKIEGASFLENIAVAVDAEAQSWLSAELKNDMITISAVPNDTKAKRTGKIKVSAIRRISQIAVENEIEISQSAVGIPPYHIVLPTDWSKTWVYTAEANGKPVAQITKEFLCLEGTIKAQAIVVYPMNESGDVLISQGGYVAEILLSSSDTSIAPAQSYAYEVPKGNVHGGIVKFLPAAYAADVATNSTGTGSAAVSQTDIPTMNKTAHFTYTPGTAEAAKEIWMRDDQYMTSFDDKVVETIVKPYIVNDNRGTDDNYSYGVVKIGCQYWLNSNLKAAHWNKGKNNAAIPLISAGWKAGTTGSFVGAYNAENDGSYLDAAGREAYGCVYSYTTIGAGNSAEEVGVAASDDNIKNDYLSPEGWIVPTLAECNTLGAYTGGLMVCGQIHLPQPHSTENNIAGFNATKTYNYASSKFTFATNYTEQWLTRTYVGPNCAAFTARTNYMYIAKNRHTLDRLDTVRCLNNGAISVR